MAAQDGALFTGVDIPDAYRLVLAGGNQLPPIGWYGRS
jgi:hypothetical protein